MAMMKKNAITLLLAAALLASLCDGIRLRWRMQEQEDWLLLGMLGRITNVKMYAANDALHQNAIDILERSLDFGGKRLSRHPFWPHLLREVKELSEEYPDANLVLGKMIRGYIEKAPVKEGKMADFYGSPKGSFFNDALYRMGINPYALGLSATPYITQEQFWELANREPEEYPAILWYDWRGRARIESAAIPGSLPRNLSAEETVKIILQSHSGPVYIVRNENSLREPGGVDVSGAIKTVKEKLGEEEIEFIEIIPKENLDMLLELSEAMYKRQEQKRTETNGK